MSGSPTTKKKARGGGQPGAGRGNGKASPAAKAKLQSDPLPQKSQRTQHDRLLYTLINLVGQHVSVQVCNGRVYKGLFHTASTDTPGGMGVVLRMARMVVEPTKRDDELANTPPLIDTLVINGADMVMISAEDVNFITEAPVAKARARDTFRTDAETGPARSGGNHDLVAWGGDDDEDVPTNLSLENTFGTHGKWDQFATNERLYQVKSTFQEELYTTQLDMSKISDQQRREAEKMARDIMGMQGQNIHQREERGQQMEGEVDEEDRYGAVIRDDPKSKPVDPKANTGKYVPPAKRDPAQKTPAQGPQPTPPSPVYTGMVGKKAPDGFSLDGNNNNNMNDEAHREHIRLREQMMRKDPSRSPTGTTRKSPLISPLVGDAVQMDALNLDPATPAVPEEVKRDFVEFQRARANSGGNRQSTISQLKEDQARLDKKLPKTESTLNPNAKEFKFNPNAAAFVFKPAAAAPAPAPVATVAHGFFSGQPPITPITTNIAQMYGEKMNAQLDTEGLLASQVPPVWAGNEHSRDLVASVHEEIATQQPSRMAVMPQTMMVPQYPPVYPYQYNPAAKAMPQQFVTGMPIYPMPTTAAGATNFYAVRPTMPMYTAAAMPYYDQMDPAYLMAMQQQAALQQQLGAGMQPMSVGVQPMAGMAGMAVPMNLMYMAPNMMQPTMQTSPPRIDQQRPGAGGSGGRKHASPGDENK